MNESTVKKTQEHTEVHTHQSAPKESVLQINKSSDESLGTKKQTSAHTHTNTKGEHAHHEPHTHHHDAESTKAILNRMSRAIGHMESIKGMIADERDCSEVLIQIAAVRSAINNIGKIILEDHINHCVVDALETGDTQVLEDLKEAIDKFVK